jgi:tetrahydromethanopterin S-methyltransferase subunit A
MKITDVAGEICKIVLPIHEDVFYGNSNSRIGICTLSSMSLLRDIAGSDLLSKISIVGRLLSENKGIDALIHYVIKNPTLDTIVVCGAEVVGHRTGHSLVSLYRYGTDQNSRIINSVSPDPILVSSKSEIRQFQNQVTLIDRIGEIRLEKIREIVNSI